MNYKDYLRSDHWKKRRQRFIKNTHKRCFICRAKNVVFHVHHKRYTNLGNEKHNDLRLLCEKCHNTVHKHHLEEYLVNGKIKRTVLRDWIKRLNHEKIKVNKGMSIGEMKRRNIKIFVGDWDK